jgi:peptidoglycan/xylan/chitin deacetylase (PgdA/CDA1 family)
MAQQTVILKADDLRYDPEHVVSPRWSRFVGHLVSEDIPAAFGLIGKSLEAAPEEFCKRQRALLKLGTYEIWNHGYDHALKRDDGRGGVWSEFKDTSLDHQRNHLLRTQVLARERLDVTLRTFGAPGNAIDRNTVAAVDACDDIEVWLFGNPASCKRVLKRTIDAEHPTHNPDFDAFRARYRPDIEPLVLQLHPNSWDDARLEQFIRIVAFLKEAGAAFATPSEYARAAR